MGILTIVVLSRVIVSNPQQLNTGRVPPRGLTLIDPQPNVTLHNNTLVGTFTGLQEKPDQVECNRRSSTKPKVSGKFDLDSPNRWAENRTENRVLDDFSDIDLFIQTASGRASFLACVVQQPAETSVSPSSSPLGTFRGEETSPLRRRAWRNGCFRRLLYFTG